MTERRESQDEMPLGTIHFFTPHDEIPMERGKHNVWFESDRVAIHDLGDAYLDGGRYGDIWEEEKSAIVLEEESYSLHPAGVVERRFSNHFDTNVAFDHVVNNLPFITHLYLPDDTIFYSHVQLSFVDDKVLHGGY